jgi:diaminobutyrate-2-oxoglutarate transaminase
MDMKIFEELESQVRTYSRSFPAVFSTARGYTLRTADGREYIDFFAGAGALNYGHNEPRIKARLIDYLTRDGVAHSLDMATEAKAEFLERFRGVILEPRGLDYRLMFTGPTGTNSVESALKLARKVTGRTTVVAFTNAFHGMTLGALAVTGNAFKRAGAGVPLGNVVHVPYEGYLGDVDTLAYLRRILEEKGSGLGLPAAIILETVQGEGGINVASSGWLREVERICRQWGILLIVDDVQTGCGRTGPFFSWESAGIHPDIVCLSKSIGGYGLPMALTLIRPEYDIWSPGEHNGTFRGNNLAFVAAAEALSYWENDDLTRAVLARGDQVCAFLELIALRYPEIQAEVRGRGLLWGLSCGVPGLAGRISAAAFRRGLLVETSGPEGHVVKIMPPLTIDEQGLERGLNLLEESVRECLGVPFTAIGEEPLVEAAR